jgi:nucleoside-diphosphate-sugar epimerase
MTRVLMIGGTGHIGPWALAGLRELEPGAELFAMNRRGRAADGVVAFAGDRHQPEALVRALREARPDVVVDMIPFRVADAEEVVAALRSAGVAPRLVIVSSADVYAAFSRLNGLIGGEPEAGPIAEDAPLREGEGAQGAEYDKLGVERAYALALGDVTALRLPAVYGWADVGRIADWADPMLDGAEEVRMHPRLARWRFARVFCGNAGWAVALAALRAGPGVRAFNVAEPVSPSEREWAECIGRAVGWQGRIVEDEEQDAPRFRADQDIVLDDRRIREALGFGERHDPEDGLRDNVRRYAEGRGA